MTTGDTQAAKDAAVKAAWDAYHNRDRKMPYAEARQLWEAMWDACDFSWEGLADAGWERGEDANEAQKLKRWHAPEEFPVDGRVQSEGRASIEASLQDYWRWTPNNLLPHEAQRPTWAHGRLANDDELAALGLLVAADGKAWYALHRPERDHHRPDSKTPSFGDRNSRFENTLVALENAIKHRLVLAWPGALAWLLGSRVAHLATFLRTYSSTIPDAGKRTLWLNVMLADLCNWNAEGLEFGAGAIFSSSAFANDSNFRSSAFGVAANFDSALFGDKADFRSTTFDTNASFYSATFGNKANFSRTKFGTEANFGHASFGEDAHFYGSAFAKQANFRAATFGPTTFGFPTGFQGAAFEDGAIFSSAIFGKRTEFSQATFGNAAQFSSAVFGDEIQFCSSRFGDGADFSLAVFGGQADMSDATFGANANFRSATFADGAYFGPVISLRGSATQIWSGLQPRTRRAGAIFGDRANFDGASFGRRTSFRQAGFGKAATFERTSFEDESDFGLAVFDSDVAFNSASFKGQCSFKKVTFPKRFQIRAAEIRGYADFSGVTWPAKAEDQHAAFEGCRFRDVANFKTADFCAFALFDGAEFKGRVLLTEPVAGETAPDALFARALEAAKAATVADRKAIRELSRANARLKDGETPQEIDSKSERGADARYGALAGGLRTLKLAMAAQSDVAREQRFYRYELKTRAKQPSEPWPAKLAASLYGLASDYGASIGRPFVALAILMLGFAAAFLALGWWNGEVGMDAPATGWIDGGWQAWQFSWSNVFRPFSALSAEDVPRGDPTLAAALLHEHGGAVGAGVRAVATLQSLLGIVLAFLFALAVRRRFQIT